MPAYERTVLSIAHVEDDEQQSGAQLSTFPVAEFEEMLAIAEKMAQQPYARPQHDRPIDLLEVVRKARAWLDEYHETMRRVILARERSRRSHIVFTRNDTTYAAIAISRLDDTLSIWWNVAGWSLTPSGMWAKRYEIASHLFGSDATALSQVVSAVCNDKNLVPLNDATTVSDLSDEYPGLNVRVFENIDTVDF